VAAKILERPTGPVFTETKAPESAYPTPAQFSTFDGFAAAVVAVLIVPEAEHWAVTKTWRRFRRE
jgi:hypothetical protein